MERDGQFVGESGAFLDAVEKASRAAPLDRPVLVVGERGTGKELIAERLHRLSLRWDGPFITLNCAAMPETLLEAELFGHEAGAFTGATKARAGRFEEADGGTLFLDELGTLSTGAQERLLRAVEYGEITRIGSSRPQRVDVRIVAATNADLPKMALEKSFRADLLDRLSFEVVTLPPLRYREGDIPVLVDYFGRRMAAELEWPSWPGFGRLASEALNRHDWPGNVRELRNVVERAVYQWNDHSISVDHVVFDPFESPWKPRQRKDTSETEPTAQPTGDALPVPAAPVATDEVFPGVDDMKAAVEAYEKRILETALAKSRYNQRQTAKALNLTYDQLRHSLKRHDLLGS
ncbi:phage shock protein operon transcriptional activator [Parasphingorhabdus sp.]|uniref:phage shock protein operon transcriptional activator n=1 Tax=Parasphingorhabdus sp. TaxID=2709688 RepID=UPI003C770B45